MPDRVLPERWSKKWEDEKAFSSEQGAMETRREWFLKSQPEGSWAIATSLLSIPEEKAFLCSRMIGYKPHVGEIKKRSVGSMISMVSEKLQAFLSI